MKIRTLSMAALITATAFAFGCSGGGSSGGGSASTAAGSTGVVSSALPTVDRDAAGYNFSTAYSPAVNISGAQISAMHVAPVGTQQGILVADSPFSNVSGVASGTAAVFETKFSFDASSFASLNGMTYAATANRDAPGAGDLYVRDDATGSWTLSEDSGDNEMVVAAVTSQDLYTVRGSIASPMKFKLNGTEIAAVNSSRPTAAVGFKGKLVVGATFAGANGGAASLYTLNGSTPSETKIPVNGIGGGVFQEVTSMEVATVTSGSVVRGEFLFVAVGEFDINGNALSGSVMVTTDGQVFEHVANYNGDAPTSLAWIDSTIYVGSAAGTLQYRDAQGQMAVEPGLPAVDGIQSLVVYGSDLFIGCTTANGAEVLVRVPGSGSTGPVTPTPTPQDYFYDTDVASILAAKCASCHNGGVPAAETAWPLTSPVSLLADHTELTRAGAGRIDLTTAANSLFLTKATNDTPHVGGAILSTSDADYTVLLKWIEQGAKFDNSGNTTPTPTPKSFAGDVRPLLQADCDGCHGNGGSGFNSSSYNGVVSKTNQTPGSEEMSELLRKAGRTNGTAHGGGTIWAAGSAKYDTVLQWIKDGVQQ